MRKYQQIDVYIYQSVPTSQQFSLNYGLQLRYRMTSTFTSVRKVTRLSPRGDTVIFSYIRRLGPFFGVKFLNFNIFCGFQKNECFLGYEHFVDIFRGHPKIGLVLGVIFMFLGSFLKVYIQNRDIFLGCKNFKYFFWGASNF